jgi:hypothetical protein
MFDFINKEEYFRWADEGLVTSEHFGLKAAQDAFILSILSGKSELRILEIGGGNSRILRTLAPTNECWNIDTFDGRHGGPKEEIMIPGVRNVVGLIGDFRLSCQTIISTTSFPFRLWSTFRRKTCLQLSKIAVACSGQMDLPSTRLTCI